MKDIYQRLYQAALGARKNAKAKYSNFKVGAALLTENGEIFTGANIESSSYGLTICAERVALFKALSEGDYEIKYLLVLCEAEDFCKPCGACRQIIADYAKNAEIILANLLGEYQIFKIDDLLPHSFKI